MSQEEAEEHNDLTLPPGYGLGVYTIQKSLGQGGFGITYLAYDSSLETEVVIKESLPAMFAGRSTDTQQVFTLSRSSEDFSWARERFLMEARTLAKLNHRNIVRVMRVFEALGTAYYVMPYLGGSSLDKVLENEGPLPEERINSLLRALLDALAYLHSKNLLHRDIKPANILLGADGEPILIDFGAARQLSQHSQTVVESPGYTPFEQMQTHGDIGPWSDIYALGGTMYKLITGKAPLRSTDRMGKDCQPRLANDAELCKRYSVNLLNGIDKALALAPKKRWQNAGEWLETLQGSHPQTSHSGMIKIKGRNLLAQLRLKSCAFIKTASSGTCRLWMATEEWILSRLEPKATGDNEEQNSKKSAEYEARRHRKRRFVRIGMASVLLILLSYIIIIYCSSYRRAENYYYGYGVTQDFYKAAKLYQKAADGGNPDAQFKLADMYLIGRGVDQDRQKAIELYRKLADQGYAGAQVILGQMYCSGLGVPEDQREAFHWFRKSAEQGNSEAQFRLFVMFFYGRGVDEDEQEAFVWCRKSAEQGYINAQIAMGQACQVGKVVTKDREEAIKWYRMAAAQGSTKAKKELEDMGVTP